MLRKWTPRKLVRNYGCKASLCQSRLDAAVVWKQSLHEVCGYHPRSSEADREVVFVPDDDPMAPLLAATYAASREAGDALADLPMGLVESRVDHVLGDLAAGQRLGQHGLAVMAITGNSVTLRSTNPALAIIVNRLRHGTSRRGHDDETLVQAALGSAERPRRLHPETLLAAAEVLEQYAIDATPLLDRAGRAHLRSHWLMADALRPARQEA